MKVFRMPLRKNGMPYVRALAVNKTLETLTFIIIAVVVVVAALIALLDRVLGVFAFDHCAFFSGAQIECDDILVDQIIGTASLRLDDVTFHIEHLLKCKAPMQ